MPEERACMAENTRYKKKCPKMVEINGDIYTIHKGDQPYLVPDVDGQWEWPGVDVGSKVMIDKSKRSCTCESS